MDWGVLSEIIAIGQGVRDDGCVDEGSVDTGSAFLSAGVPVLKT